MPTTNPYLRMSVTDIQQSNDANDNKSSEREESRTGTQSKSPNKRA
jgi:hypothetical protein